VIAHLLNRTLTVYREATTPDGLGGQTLGYVTVGAVPARVSRSTGTESNVAQQEGAVVTEDVYLEPGEDVRRNDFLVGDGEHFEVLHVVEPSAADVYRKAGCRRDVPAWAIPILESS
jgi:head-tail adaptor